MNTFTPGQRVEYNGEPGHVLEVLENGTVRVQMDRDRHDDSEEQRIRESTPEDIEKYNEVEAVELRGLDYYTQASQPGEDVPYSPWGYIITADGTIYGLTMQWAHGIVCALLYPEMAKEQGYGAPYKGASVYHYQRFELDNQRKLDVVRIAFGMMTPCNVSKGDKAATPAQIDGVRRALLASGKSLNDTVYGDLCDMSVRKLLKELEKARGR